MKSQAENKRIQRARMRKEGFVLKQVWVKPENWPKLKAFIEHFKK